jgi:hypothetical protein
MTLRTLLVQAVKYPILQKLLVAYPNFDGITNWAALLVPSRHERNIEGSSHFACSLVKRLGCPQQSDA